MQSSMENVSSVDDLMALSPKKTIEICEEHDKPDDLLTGDYITMQEVPLYDGMIMDADNLAYLDKCANRHQNLIDIGKESLFVKFDPLYAKQMLQSADVSQQDFEEHLYERDVGYETSSATSVLTDNIIETPKQVYGGPLISKCGKDKPTQVVPPVVSIDPSKAITTQAKATPVLVRSVSAILSSSHVATDRLISISGSTPPTAAPRSPRHKQYRTPEVDRLQSLRVILQNQDQEVLQLRQENRELKSSLQDTEHKFSRTREEMENRIKKLTDERDTLLDRECKLVLQLNNKTLSNKQMCIVMEEYEKTISSLIDEQQKIILERDQALNHLSSMESSFNDLLAKYEKSKSVILEVRDREKMFNLTIAEYEAGMRKYEELYNNLKQITADNLEKANETLENIKKSHSVEITKMNATIKKHEVMISSLQESLTQKTRDNEELTRICDQLINEVR